VIAGFGSFWGKVRKQVNTFLSLYCIERVERRERRREEEERMWGFEPAFLSSLSLEEKEMGIVASEDYEI